MVSRNDGLLRHKGWRLEIRKELEIIMLPQSGDKVHSHQVGSHSCFEKVLVNPSVSCPCCGVWGPAVPSSPGSFLGMLAVVHTDLPVESSVDFSRNPRRMCAVWEASFGKAKAAL